jgi:hypothetical protein
MSLGLQFTFRLLNILPTRFSSSCITVWTSELRVRKSELYFVRSINPYRRSFP